MKTVLSANNLKKTYHRGSEDVHAVDGISFEAGPGEMTAIIGPSGSGKTTLLNILGCLDNPSEGSLSVGGELIFGGAKELSEKKLTGIRRRNFGYIFQKFYLIPTLTVMENIMLPSAFYRNCEVCKTPQEVLMQLGIGNRAGHLPLRAFRRRDAACGDSARADKLAEDTAGRRAHRQSGFETGR